MSNPAPHTVSLERSLNEYWRLTRIAVRFRGTQSVFPNARSQCLPNADEESSCDGVNPPAFKKPSAKLSAKPSGHSGFTAFGLLYVPIESIDGLQSARLLTGPFFFARDCKYVYSRGESQGAFTRIFRHELLANCWPFVCKSGHSAQMRGR